jgi:hypothetical protein
VHAFQYALLLQWQQCQLAARTARGREHFRVFLLESRSGLKITHATVSVWSTTAAPFVGRDRGIQGREWPWWEPGIWSKDLLHIKKKLRGFIRRANHTDRATAACRWSQYQPLRIEDATWSARRISYGRNLGFLDWSRYFLFQVAPQLYSRGSVDPVSDPLLLRKSGSAGNRSRTSGSVARNSDH